jgi:hypothetical protein
MAQADFEPKRKVVTAITNANPAVVTAATHNYTSDDYVTLNIPLLYGMRLPRITVKILVVNVNSFSIEYDTSLLDPFVVPGIANFSLAEVLPVSAATDNIA